MGERHLPFVLPSPNATYMIDLDEAASSTTQEVSASSRYTKVFPETLRTETAGVDDEDDPTKNGRLGRGAGDIDVLYSDYREQRSAHAEKCDFRELCNWYCRMAPVRFLVGFTRFHSAFSFCFYFTYRHQLLDVTAALPTRGKGKECAESCFTDMMAVVSRARDEGAEFTTELYDGVGNESKGDHDQEGAFAIMAEPRGDNKLEHHYKQEEKPPRADGVGTVPTSVVRALVNFIVPSFDFETNDEGKNSKEKKGKDAMRPTDDGEKELLSVVEENVLTASLEPSRTNLLQDSQEVMESYVDEKEGGNNVLKEMVVEQHQLPTPTPGTKTLEELSIEVFSENPAASMLVDDISSVAAPKEAGEVRYTGQFDGGKIVCKLILDDNKLGRDGWTLLCRWLTTPPSCAGLQQLSLAHCALGQHATRLLASSLPSLSSLVGLNVACNPNLDMACLALALSNSNAAPKLATLDVTFCEALECDLTQLAVIFTRGECCPNSRELDMSQSVLPLHWSSTHLALLSSAFADWGWVHHESEKVNDSDVESDGEMNNVTSSGSDSSEIPSKLLTTSSASAAAGPDEEVRMVPKKLACFEKIGRRMRMLSHRWLEIDDLRKTR